MTLHSLLAALEADPALRPATSRAIRESLPGYEGVPEPSLEASIGRNLALSLRTRAGLRIPRRSTRPRPSPSSGWGRGCPSGACWPASGSA
jgi:hypothetical protein